MEGWRSVTAYRLLIECSEGHKRTTVGSLEHSGDVTTGGAILLVNDLPIPAEEVYGTSRGGPTNPASAARYRTSGRSRHEIVCRRCGLRAEMRHDKAVQLMAGLIPDASLWIEVSSGVCVSRLQLRSLVASL